MRRTCFLLLGLLAVAAPASLRAQMGPDSLPVKVGLWDTTVHFDGAGGRVMSRQSCYTKESYKELLGRADSMSHQAGCTITKNEQSGHQWTMDFACKTAQMQMSGHTVATIRDDEHVSSTSTTTGTVNGKPMNMNTTVDSHFVSSDCGSVKPYTPKQ